MASSNGAASGGIALKEAKIVRERPYACTYQWCQHRFETEREMKRHKKNDPDHFYCKKCDVDCHSWEELTAHKIEMMAPYVEGRKRPTEEDPPAHIACEFCGEDFKSFGGRKSHRAQMHPANQDLSCPGCGAKFIRAANMIAHLEQEKCPKISKQKFYSNIDQRYIVKQIMQNPEIVQQNLTACQANCMGGQDQDAYKDTCMNLIDKNDEAQNGGLLALQPEQDPSLRQQKSEAWPRLSIQDSVDLEGSLSRVHLGSMQSQDWAMTESDVSSRQAPVFTSSTMAKPSALNLRGASKILFPHALPTPPSGDQKIMLKQKEMDAAAKDTINLFTSRFWDPQSKEYKVDIFWNPFLRVYCCPFPSCSDGTGLNTTPAQYLTAFDIEAHIELAHTRRICSCPTCFKRFDTMTALVAHSESTSKCGIRESSGYNKFLNEMSGGFLTSKEMHVPKIYRPTTDLVKKDRGTNGVMATKYTSRNPNE